MITDGRAIEVAGDHLEKRIGGEASYVVLGVEEEKPGLKFVSSKIIAGDSQRNLILVVDADAASVIDSGKFDDVLNKHRKSELQEVRDASRYICNEFDKLTDEMEPENQSIGSNYRWSFDMNDIKLYRSKNNAICGYTEIKLWRYREKTGTRVSSEKDGLYLIVYKDGQVIDKGKYTNIKKEYPKKTRLGKAFDYL